MKKVLVMMALSVILPAMVFAQFSIGPAVFLKSPVLAGQIVDNSEFNVNQCSFGADARVRLGILQAEGLILYSAGSVQSVNMYFDAGVAIDIAMFTLSLGAGPNVTKVFGWSGIMQAGFNTKFGADVRLGDMTIGASYIMDLNITNARFRTQRNAGLLGMHVLFEL